MPQITIYLDEETARRMEASVRKAGISKSRWIADAVRSKSADEWTQEIKDMVGSWDDFPESDEIRSAMGIDAPRERL